MTVETKHVILLNVNGFNSSIYEKIFKLAYIAKLNSKQ